MTAVVPPMTRTATDGARRTRGSDYADLMRHVKEAGLLDRRYAYYLIKMAVTGVLLVAGWAAFVILGDSWWTLLIAALLALVFTQIGFIGHDAGHRQIFRSRRANYLLGLVHGNFAVGLSYGWWVDKHIRHHAHPNQEGKDPDIAIGVLAFSADQARAKRGLVRFMARCQAYLFFPLLTLEAVNLHLASIRAWPCALRHRRWEAALLLAHSAGYLTCVFLVLSPGKAVVFILVQQGLFGLCLGVRSRPTTRACRSSTPTTRPTSCAARCSPPATCAAAG